MTKAETTSGKTVSKALDALMRDRANIMGLVMTQAKTQPQGLWRLSLRLQLRRSNDHAPRNRAVTTVVVDRTPDSPSKPSLAVTNLFLRGSPWAGSSCTRSEPSSGAARYVSELVAGLAANHAHVTLFCPPTFDYLGKVRSSGAAIASRLTAARRRGTSFRA